VRNLSALFSELGGDLTVNIIASVTKLKLENREGGTLQDKTGLIRSTSRFDLQIHADVATNQDGNIGPEARARIEKEIAELERAIDKHRRQLSDQSFLSKAPERITAGMRAKLADYEAQLIKKKELLGAL